MIEHDHQHDGKVVAGCGPTVEVSMPAHISADWDMGRKELVTVTAARRVYAGDMVALTHELARDGDPLRVAYDGGKLLAATSSQVINDLGNGRVPNVAIWAFAQDGGLYLKTAKRANGDWMLGATVYAGELEPERAVLVYTRAQIDASNSAAYVTLLYEEEGQGVAQVYKLQGLTLTKERDMVWCETCPANYTACWATCRSYWNGPALNQTDGHGTLVNVAYQTEGGNIALVCLDVYSGEVFNTVELATGPIQVPAWPMGKEYKFSLTAPDGQEYLSDAWHLLCYRRRGTCWLTYPGADGRRHVLEYTTCYAYDSEAQQNRREAVAYGCRPLILDGYVPCGGGVSNLDTRENHPDSSGIYLSDIPVDADLAEMPWLVGAIARTGGGTAQKALLGIERWLGGREHYLQPMGYLESADAIAKNIGLVSCCRCGPYKSAMAVAYQTEGKIRAALVYDLDTDWKSRSPRYCMGAPLASEPACGPDVELATADNAMVLVEMDKAPALIYQRDGSIWLQNLAVHEVAAATKSRSQVDAVAITGGSPGKTIKVAILRPIEHPEEVDDNAENDTSD